MEKNKKDQIVDLDAYSEKYEIIIIEADGKYLVRWLSWYKKQNKLFNSKEELRDFLDCELEKVIGQMYKHKAHLIQNILKKL